MRDPSRRLLRIAAALAMLAPSARAQCVPGGPPNPSAAPRTIAGIVLDQANRPLPDVDVGTRNPRRHARTRADGRFDLADLDTGTYEVIVRRLGYLLSARRYVVSDSGGVARFCLVAEPRRLAPVISSMTGGGLSGVVTDAAFKPIAGAEVRAMGEGEHTTTDSTGEFHLALKRGTYAIAVTKQDYGRQLVGVTIPKDSGRQVVVQLGAPPRNANRQADLADQMRQRMIWAAPNRSGLMSAEDLLKTSADLRAAAQITARTGVSDDCDAIVDGSYSLPVYMIDKRDVALMEVYGLAPPRRTVKSIDPRGTAPRPAAPMGRCNVRVYVWMKQP